MHFFKIKPVYGSRHSRWLQIQAPSAAQSLVRPTSAHHGPAARPHHGQTSPAVRAAVCGLWSFVHNHSQSPAAGLTRHSPRGSAVRVDHLPRHLLAEVSLLGVLGPGVSWSPL